ncbi:PAS:Response regulator receiver:ATP-binding region, ATPase-like:Histidine kinase A-like protein [Melioribacter roseus P3M-2]|uniref:histidine kinase n=1 Tax=Melioribacter roseus (strain DSM 23840 / JCM 17771 / VKM B-2668 / P3M-2) TaxID=1191523 RepID=I6Z8J7_MELRP|nr:PAS domain S-box protein [Melioribacter roseus]AFN75480.1 PAS:Response regulator receiver:ATP-binding region, ATPase-like:Histidine kinase A-like protein [Melioribacter roseus P3M-2]
MNYENKHGLIVDKNGKIIAVSNDIKKLFPGLSPQNNFLQYWKDVQSVDKEYKFRIIEKFEECRRNNAPAAFDLPLTINDNRLTYTLVYTPLKSENNIYFYIDFILSGKSKTEETDTYKIRIALNQIEDLIEDDEILKVIDRVKNSYPFTFIEKVKFQKEINGLKNFFWIKDRDDKIVVANEAYASWLGTTPSKLENKSESDYLPKYLVNLYSRLNEYIKNTSNIIAVSGLKSAGDTKNFSIYLLPVCDLENNVIALIGFSYVETDKEIVRSLTRHIPLPACVVGENLELTEYNEKFESVFELSGKKSKLHEVFGRDAVNKIASFLKENKKYEDKLFDIETADKKLYSFTALKEVDRVILSGYHVEKQTDENASLDIEDYLKIVPDAAYVYDLENLKFLAVTDEALKLYGYSKEKFLELDLTDLYAPEDVQALIQSDDKSLRGKPLKHKRSDGKDIYVTIKSVEISYKGKKAHLNLVREVSFELKTRRENQLYRHVFENTGDLVIVTDKDGFIVSINDSVTRQLGFSQRELEGRPIISIVSDEDRAVVNKNVLHAESNNTIKLNVSVKKSEGELTEAEIAASKIKDYEGKVEQVVFLIRLQPEEKRNLTAEVANETSNIDAAFLSNLFHELLTPLNVIMGFTQDLWENIENPNDEQKESVEIIKENQRTLLQIMDNAVEYAAFLRKNIKYKIENVRLTDLLPELEEVITKTAKQHGKTVKEGKISSSLEFETDKQKFLSLLGMLINFAVTITKEKELKLSAKKEDDDNLIILIDDLKEGASPYLLKGMHDILTDDENLNRRNYGFSRFSMKLAKKLMEILGISFKTLGDKDKKRVGIVVPFKFTPFEGGEIEIEESPRPVEEKFERPAEKPISNVVEKQATNMLKKLDLTSMTCLYLEDQVDSQILFKSQMKDLKTIEVAPSLEAAIPLLKTRRFDFLIVDINLQGEYNGLDVLRIVRKMPGYKDIPIIASTAYMQPGARENFIAAGFTDFISKPLLRDKVIEILTRIYSAS